MHMNSVTPEEVARIASLARLSLSHDETAQAAVDLSGILSHFSALSDIDTSGVLPADDASGLKNIVRKDEAVAEAIASTESVLKNVPRMKDGYVQVAGVFSGQAME